MGFEFTFLSTQKKLKGSSIQCIEPLTNSSANLPNRHQQNVYITKRSAGEGALLDNGTISVIQAATE